MTSTAGLIVQVRPGETDDRRDLLILSDQLRTLLIECGVAEVTPQPGEDAPPATKGAGLAESLAVKLGAVLLSTAVRKIREWGARTGRTVQVTIDGDEIEVGRPTPAQQEQLIRAWLERHAPRD